MMSVAEPAGPQDRVIGNLAFVESVARRVAASMPHTIDLGDLVQDGMLGLIDAANRFDEARGIKFETFAERRVRGAMIDALRREAWPRGVRRQRRELEAAREALRRELGAEPSLADLAARVGTDETRLGRTIVRISTIESTSALTSPEHPCESSLPEVCVPPEEPAPDAAYEHAETRDRIRRAIASLPARERKVIALYYYRDVTMKQIGKEIGVNESRVSQLHARAIQRLRKALVLSGTAAGAPANSVAGARTATASVATATPEPMTAATIASMLGSLLEFTGKASSSRAAHSGATTATKQIAAADARRGIVLTYPITSRAARSRSASLNGLGSQRQPESSRKRSASVPATSPVTKITRRASGGELAAMAR
jgi:RNA polymerase sigma factor for flagellar operon FliA